MKENIKFTNSGLSFLYFIFHFHFLFLEHRVRVKDNGVEGSRTNDVKQHVYHMLTSYATHGHLG